MMAMPYLNMVDNMAHVYLTVENDDCSEVPTPEEHHVGVDHAEEAACEGVSCSGLKSWREIMPARQQKQNAYLSPSKR